MSPGQRSEFTIEEKIDLRNRRNQAFKVSLAELRLKLGVINGFLILLAVGVRGNSHDYLIALSYLVMSVLCLTLPPLNRIAKKFLYLPLLGIDLAVGSYMLARTGGADSVLIPFLFIPVITAVVRCKYPGIIAWCTVMAAVLVGVAIATGTLKFIPLLVKVVYLYVLGVIGGYLVHQTYMVSEEVSTRLARWNNDLQRLNDYLKEVTGSDDIDQIFEKTLAIIKRNNPNSLTAIMIFDEKGVLKLWSQKDWDDEWRECYERNPLNINSLTLAPILVFKKPLICPDITKHPELIKTFNGIPIQSLFAVPLVVENDVAGVIMVGNATTRRLSEQEIQILISIANQAGLGIKNIASLSQQRLKADTDGLTGLYNRRYFNEQIETLVNMVLERGQSLSLIILDIDNFKHYNDTFGHPAGDMLLKEVALALSEAIREQDILARYGGEEFAVILKNTDNHLALQVAERVRQSVAHIPPERFQSPVSVSVGVGTAPDHALDWAKLIDFADKSLYYAKQTGKNRVCCGYPLKVI